MTNLGWLAAVLQPRDVAVHPNFASEDDDRRGPSLLASIILGGDWRRVAEQEPIDATVARELALVEAALNIDTLPSAVAELAYILEFQAPSDMAQAAAMALVVAAMACEIDDYEMAFAAIARQLDRLAGEVGSDALLLRAALLQQRALREIDTGRDAESTAREVGELLGSLDPRNCSFFRTSKGVAWESAVTVAGIQESLVDAASRTLPWSDVPSPGHLLGRIDLVKRPPTIAVVRAAFARNEQYTRFVSELFGTAYGRNEIRFGGPGPADVFHAQLGLELLGSPTAIDARKEVALLRLVRRGLDANMTADSLRLLRQAGAKAELELLLRRLEAAGPLVALSIDARRILAARLGPKLLGSLEVKVLTAASELLTSSEARIAFDAIARSLAEGEPRASARQRGLEVLGREVAWLALAALAAPADCEGLASVLLLDEARRIDANPELADRGMYQALARLDLRALSASQRTEWLEFASARRSELPATADRLGREFGQVFDVPKTTSLERLTAWTNGRLGGHDVGDPPADGLDALRSDLAATREAASRGAYSFGGNSGPEVAAALLSLGVDTSLWTDLAPFLLDARVQFDQRSPALDRLSRADILLPEAVVEQFKSGVHELLEGVPPNPFGSKLTPYPAGLRFLAAHGLLSDEAIYDSLAELAGSSDAEARREASLTISVLAARRPRPELLALALLLSRDIDAEVRGHSGRALSALARFGDVLSSVARRRLGDLLGEDGMRVPLLVLRGIEETGEPILEALRGRVADLASDHPSRSVRSSAARALASGR